MAHLVRNDTSRLDFGAVARYGALDDVVVYFDWLAVGTWIVRGKRIPRPIGDTGPVRPDTGPSARCGDLYELDGEGIDKPIVVPAVRQSVGAVVVELPEVHLHIRCSNSLHDIVAGARSDPTGSGCVFS